MFQIGQNTREAISFSVRFMTKRRGGRLAARKGQSTKRYFYRRRAAPAVEFPVWHFAADNHQVGSPFSYFGWESGKRRFSARVRSTRGAYRLEYFHQKCGQL
jgi:hypothetical protein